MTVLGVYREKRFSPGKVEADAAVLDATLEELSYAGCQVRAIAGESLSNTLAKPVAVLSMAQSEEALALLEEWSGGGVRVINSVHAIRNCYRKPLIRLLLESKLPIPASRIISLQEAVQEAMLASSGRFWLKRGDVHAMQSEDVTAINSRAEMRKALEHFCRQSVEDVLVQEHVEGLVVKFYGVGENAYFRAFLADTGEEITSRAGALRDIVQQAARTTGLEVYGGDAILTADDRVILIDLNDWPSFSRCYQSAAKSIARYLMRNENGQNYGSA